MKFNILAFLIGFLIGLAGNYIMPARKVKTESFPTLENKDQIYTTDKGICYKFENKTVECTSDSMQLIS